MIVKSLLQNPVTAPGAGLGPAGVGHKRVLYKPPSKIHLASAESLLSNRTNFFSTAKTTFSVVDDQKFEKLKYLYWSF